MIPFTLPAITALRPRAKTLDDLPEKPRLRMMAVISIVGSLAWDYADTVLDIAVLLRDPRTKKLSRAVRQLRADYESFRRPFLSSSDTERERELGLLFESLCEPHFSRLCWGVAAEKATAGLGGDSMAMVQAVHTAMAVLEAMALYAGECDRWIREQGVSGRSILPSHFRGLSILLPEFAGDCYAGDSEARRITVRILLNEINSIEIYDDNGKV